MAHSLRPIIQNSTTHIASTMKGTDTRVKKRDAQAMESDTSPSRKRQRTGRGFVGLGAGSSAEDLYLDVRDGARIALEDRKDFTLDVFNIEYERVKRRVWKTRPVGSLNTSRYRSKDQDLAVSLEKSRPSFNNLKAGVLRRMASKSANPSTPLARIGRLEHQCTRSAVNDILQEKANDTVTRFQNSLEHAPNLRRASSFPQHHRNTTTASKQQAVEPAWPIRRRSSSESARLSQLGDSDFTDTATDVERNSLRLELDRLSKGLAPPSVHNVRYILVVWSKG